MRAALTACASRTTGAGTPTSTTPPTGRTKPRSLPRFVPLSSFATRRAPAGMERATPILSVHRALKGRLETSGPTHRPLAQWIYPQPTGCAHGSVRSAPREAAARQLSVIRCRVWSELSAWGQSPAHRGRQARHSCARDGVQCVGSTSATRRTDAGRCARRPDLVRSSGAAVAHRLEQIAGLIQGRPGQYEAPHPKVTLAGDKRCRASTTYEEHCTCDRPAGATATVRVSCGSWSSSPVPSYRE